MKRITLVLYALLGFVAGASAQTNPGFNPNLQWCGVQGSIAIRGSANWQCLLPGTNGQALLSGGPGANPAWTTLTGTGTVTSVSGSGGTTGLTLTGGPITGAGTLTLGGSLVLANGGIAPVGSANTVLKSNGSAASWGTVDNANVTAGTLTNAAINANAAIVVSKLATQPALSLVANITGGAAVPTTPTVTALLDAAFSSTQGSVLYRNVGGWSALPPGTAGYYLQTGGTGANPAWAPASGAPGVGTVTSVSLGEGVTGNINPIVTTGTIVGNAPFRNRLINGASQIWQRGTSGTYANSVLSFAQDRFYGLSTGGNPTWTRVAGNGQYKNALQITGAANTTQLVIGQRIEAENIRDLASTTVSFSVTISCSTLTTVTWRSQYANALDNWSAATSIASNTFTVNSTPTRYSTTISLPPNAINGIDVALLTGSFTSGTCTYTGWQLEPGSIVTPFETRDIGDVLRQSLRYYETASSNCESYAFAVNEGANSFPQMNVEKRAPPIVTYSIYAAINVTDHEIIASPYTPTRNVYVRCLSAGSGKFTANMAYYADAEL